MPDSDKVSESLLESAADVERDSLSDDPRFMFIFSIESFNQLFNLPERRSSSSSYYSAILGVYDILHLLWVHFSISNVSVDYMGLGLDLVDIGCLLGMISSCELIYLP